MGGVDKLAWPRRRPPAPRAHPRRRSRRRPGVERDRRRDRAGRDATTWRGAPWLPARVDAVVAGGATRQDSVAAGFARPGGPASRTRPATRVVLVHDGARPLVADGLVARRRRRRRRRTARPSRSCPVAETVKRIDGDRIVATVDRATLALAQTPQGVRRGAPARGARRRRARPTGTWTDEAALLEACRIAVHVVPGDPVQPQGDRARRSRPRRRRSSRPAAARPADGHRPRQPPVRAGRSRCASAA